MPRGRKSPECWTRQAQQRQLALDDYLQAHPKLAAGPELRRLAEQTAQESEGDSPESAWTPS